MDKRTILNCPVSYDKTSFLDLLSLSAGYSIYSQKRMGELVIKSSGWNVDLRELTIKFGENKFGCGVIGSESEKEGTWLWGWANTESGLKETATAVSRKAKKLLRGVPEFENGKFMLDELHTGHNLAMVCSGVSEKSVCYYRCPYNGGAAFVQISGLPDDVFVPAGREIFSKQIMEIISSFYCDHRLLAIGFLWQNQTPFTEKEDYIEAEFPDEALKISFEKAGEISRIKDVNFMIRP